MSVGIKCGIVAGALCGIQCGESNPPPVTGPTTLTVSVADSADPVASGTAYTYSTTVTNTGANDAALVSVQITLSSSLQYNSSSGAGWSFAVSGQVVTATRPTLGAGLAAPDIVVNVTGLGGGPDTVSASSTAQAFNASPVSDSENTTITYRSLVLVLGQSNAFGQQSSGNITNSQRTGIGASYANVGFRQKSAQARANPPTWTTDSTGNLSSYTSSSNNLSGHGIDGLGLGVSQSLGRHLDYYTANKFNVCCVAISGTDLANDWNPSGTFPTGTNLYNQALTVAAAYEITANAKVRAIVWVQGETDANDAGKAAAYEANLTNFINTIRGTYNVPFIISGLSTNSTEPQKATIRTAQTNVAGALSNVTLVNTDALTLTDGDHYGANDYAALGDYLADAVVTALAIASPVSWTIDKYSLIGVPANATEWTAVMTAAGIGSGNPSALWLMQEASGNLADSIGGFTMTPDGTTGITYQAVNIDWQRKAVQIAEGTSAKSFANSSASLPDPSTTSQAQLIYAFVGNSASSRNLYTWGNPATAAIARNSGGSGTQWQLTDAGLSTVSTDNVANQVRPWVHERKVTVATGATSYTDNSSISRVLGVVAGKKITIGSATNPLMAWFYAAHFFGTAAELTTAQWRTLLQTLNWGNANIGATAIPW